MKTHKKYKTQEKKRFERKSLVIKIVMKLKTHWTVKNKNSRLGTAGENKELENNSKHFIFYLFKFKQNLGLQNCMP